MYVEAFCPLCFASHIVAAEMRGEKYRCEECEEVFIINKKSKKTDKKPPRPREVKPADEPEEVAEALPEAKLVEAPPKKKARADDDEVLEIPDDALQSGSPVLKTSPAPKRRAARDERDEDEDRPKKRRRDEDDEEDDRPRKRPVRRSGMPVGLIAALGGGVVILLGLVCAGALWFAFPYVDTGKAQAKVPQPVNNPPKVDPPKINPPQIDPPKIDPPKVKSTERAPKIDPPKPPPAVWNVKADPPAAPVKLAADFKTEIKVAGTATQVVFPTSTASPFVAVGNNAAAGDERQVWNLQTNKMTGKLIGQLPSLQPPILSPDGAHIAIIPAGKPGTVDVWALGPGKVVNIPVSPNGVPPEVIDFAGPGRLLTGRRINAGREFEFVVWDAATGQSALKFGLEFAGPPVGGVNLSRDTIAISPGGAYLALMTGDTLRVFDLKTGVAVGQRALPQGAPGRRILSCRGLSFSPDGSELAGLFHTNNQMRLVCWDVAKGDAVADIAFGFLTLMLGMDGTYRGHVLDWVGDRRGWLLYGAMMIDRKADKVGPQPPGLTDPNYAVSHLIGPDHVATLPGGGGNKVLTVTRFDPAKFGGR